MSLAWIAFISLGRDVGAILSFKVRFLYVFARSAAVTGFTGTEFPAHLL